MGDNIGPELVGGVPGDILGILVDMIQKYRSGGLTKSELARVVKREQPFLGKGGGFCSLLSLGEMGGTIYHVLRNRGVEMGSYTAMLLEHLEYTRHIRYHLATIDVEEFPGCSDGVTFRDALTEAKNRQYKPPPAEVAPLFCNAFSEDDLCGHSFLVMHKPIQHPSEGKRVIFSFGTSASGKMLFQTWRYDNTRFYTGYRFVFLVSQEPPARGPNVSVQFG